MSCLWDTSRPKPSVNDLLIGLQHVLSQAKSRMKERLILFVRGVRVEMVEYSAEYIHPPDVWYDFGGLLAIIIVCTVSATGLLRRRMWARWLTLILATVPLCAVVVEKAIYKRHPGFDFTPMFLTSSIWALVPIGLWWWLVLTRKRVMAQFVEKSLQS